MSMLGNVVGFNLNDRKKNMEVRELLRQEPVSLSVRRSRLRWFCHVEHKSDADLFKQCVLMEIEGTHQRGKTWWDCVEVDMENFGLSLEVAQDRDQLRLKTEETG